MEKRAFLVWMLCLAGSAVGVLWLVAASKPATAQGGATTIRASIASDGSQGNALSSTDALSADGRFVVFQSWADNLVSDDTNRSYDVLLHDLQARQTTRISVASDGTEGDYDSGSASLSADGHYIAFSSEASNLVLDDTNGVKDVFVHDRQTGATERVSLASDGTQGNATSWLPAISADGRYIAFQSAATNFVEGETGIFVHDRHTRQTELVSIASDGTPGNAGSIRPDLSADGRYVTFLSLAHNLVEHDTNGLLDVFVHDRHTGETTRVSVASDGTEGNRESGDPAISADGRYITFASFADNLVPNDTNYNCPIGGDPNPNCLDVFVHDRHTGETTRVSVASDGTQGNSDSGPHYLPPAISADGRYVAFWSAASNLVPGDTNQELDAFRHDRLTGETLRVSVASDGSESHPTAFSPVVVISADGQRVAFNSDAPDLVPDDTNNTEDVFVRILSDEPSAIGLTTPTAIAPLPSASALLVPAAILLLVLAFREARRKQQA